MGFSKIEVSEAKLVTAKGGTEIELVDVKFFFDAEKLLLDIASKRTSNIKHPYNEFIIDEFSMAKTDCKSFSLDEKYHLESILLLTDNTNTIWAFRLRISNVHMGFMESDLLRVKHYIESNDEYVTYKKLKFGVHISNVFIEQIEGEIKL
jgi:hypothetical protein